ncbi:WD40 repeat-like protein [Exidia glandulosa HHB12029]|uniref:DDB1- and CUL4-associated factor 13 n=1 Tax=Exidia glandulosa HHB12029 TaxID=1314781 RepID=A0A165K9H8_EXIGL|nr:WD40 repeat-like protein [Exidia glandulosa HHB12029]
MKIKVLQRDLSEHLPQKSGDPTPTHRNLNPLMHPFARARERVRALNAAKMEKMFARPFVASLEGHADQVEVLARKPDSLNVFTSASADGEIIVHDLPQRTQLLRIPNAHKNAVTGLTFADANRVLSCGIDKFVRIWDISTLDQVQTSIELDEEDGARASTSKAARPEPLATFAGKAAFNTIDHHYEDALFATGSNCVQIWDEEKSAAISNITFASATETVKSIRFNASEPSVLASVGTDRSFTLYDIRTGKAERRIIMQASFSMQANALSWSPTFPTSILLASEDHNLYTYDIRSLASPSQIYKGHVAAVMSCDWSPTGTEFVSGGWDRTVQIWKEGMGHSPDVYHSKRMQRVLSTIYTADARFVLSGSDDGNVRLWKARASDRLGVMDTREKAAMEYRDSLKARWKADKEVGKVLRSHHVPKPVYKAAKLKNTMLDARRVKEERRRAHTRAGASKPKAARRSAVIVEQA